MARGTADLVDAISVKHISGGHSNLQLKSYSEGRTKWQGTSMHVIWLDEECDADLYYEALSRGNEVDGIVYMTSTPMLGVTEVVRMFLHEGSKI
jgi:phage terminase large subunit-like protein